MARKRTKKNTRKRKAVCDGTPFKMKTKRGVRCACAKTNAQGRFFAHFISGDFCPTGGKAMTYKQAQRKYG